MAKIGHLYSTNTFSPSSFPLPSLPLSRGRDSGLRVSFRPPVQGRVSAPRLANDAYMVKLDQAASGSSDTLSSPAQFISEAIVRDHKQRLRPLVPAEECQQKQRVLIADDHLIEFVGW